MGLLLESPGWAGSAPEISARVSAAELRRRGERSGRSVRPIKIARESAPHDAREDGAYPVRSFEGDLCQENPPRQTFPFFRRPGADRPGMTVSKDQRH
jgi:hypothetical protein